MGDWIVDPQLNAVRRGSIERRVEPKVMQVLVTLATGQGRVFTKEELIAAVWPDTFVSDDVLTRCVSILRRVTGDNPQTPRFIQTVPKVGYRLVAEVRPLQPSPPPEPAREQPFATPPAASRNDAAEVLPEVAPQPRPNDRPGRLLWVGLLAMAALLIVVALFWHRGRAAVGAGSRPISADSFRTVPFTFAAGEQVQPAISPDGQTMAYVRLPEGGSSRRIYLESIRGGDARELSEGADEQFSPAWSPDGKTIAFLGRGTAGLGLYLADARARSPVRRVYVPDVATHWEQGALSWSPDGRSLIFPDHRGGAPTASIWRLDTVSGDLHQLTTPPPGWEGDLTPAWSPDGRWIAFTRASETAVRNVFRLDPATGAVEQLTHDGTAIDSLTWSADSRDVVFSSNRGGKYALWQVDAAHGTLQRLPFGTEDAYQPTAGPQAGQFAYTQGSAVWSIDRLGAGAAGSTPLVSSTQQDSAPALAPDGRRLAFQSQRSGNQEIWIAGVNGEGLRQLTAMNGAVTGSPAWSFDGRSVAFDSRPDGHSHIFVISPDQGRARQLTWGDNNDIVPRWSRDNQTIYFRSNRGGQWRLWRMAADGTGLAPVTQNDGIAAAESVDGRWLYYARGGGPGLWRQPLHGGPEEEVLPDLPAGYWGYFGVAQQGIYVLEKERQGEVVQLWDPRTGQTHLVERLQGTVPQLQGLTVSADGSVLLIGQEREQGRHITLVTRR